MMFRSASRSFLNARALLGAAALTLLAFAPGAQAAPFQVGIQSNNTLIYGATTPEGRGEALDKLRATGARVVRISMPWRMVAGNTGACAGQTPELLRDHNHPCYNWGVFDQVIQGARQRQMDIVASIYEIPSWVNESDQASYTGTDALFASRVVPHWQAFQFAAASRYNTSSPYGFVRYWTIHNEPNSAIFWTPIKTSAARYPVLFRAVAPEIRAASPSALIAGGPTGPRSTVKPGKWLKAVLPAMTRNGSRPFLDAWAHNPYAGLPVGPRVRATRLPDIGISNIADLVKLLDSYAVTRKKPIWATEFAWQTSPPDRLFGTAPVNQATYLAEALDIMESTKRFRMAIWYALVDPTDIPGDFQSGFYTATGAVKPSLAMFMRPISRSVVKAKRGTAVRIWGASVVSPGTPQIQISLNGKSFKKVAGQRRGSTGTTSVTVMARQTFWVRTKDAKGAGPSRKVVVRR